MCTRCAHVAAAALRPAPGADPPRQKLRESLRIDELPADSPEARFCTDACLCRYLRARAWDVAKATKLLHGSLQWRASVDIEALRFQDVAPEAETGKMLRLPFVDKKGRPILLMRPGNENTRVAEGQLRFLEWTMEDMVRAMASGRGGFPRGSGADLAPEQMTIMVDFAGYRCATQQRERRPAQRRVLTTCAQPAQRAANQD